jgi:hypothetical protein
MPGASVVEKYFNEYILQLIQKCSYDISHWIQGGFAVYRLQVTQKRLLKIWMAHNSLKRNKGNL